LQGFFEIFSSFGLVRVKQSQARRAAGAARLAESFRPPFSKGGAGCQCFSVSKGAFREKPLWRVWAAPTSTACFFLL